MQKFPFSSTLNNFPSVRDRCPDKLSTKRIVFPSKWTFSNSKENSLSNQWVNLLQQSRLLLFLPKKLARVFVIWNNLKSSAKHILWKWSTAQYTANVSSSVTECLLWNSLGSINAKFIAFESPPLFSCCNTAINPTRPASHDNSNLKVWNDSFQPRVLCWSSLPKSWILFFFFARV